MGVTANAYGGSFWGDKMDYSYGCTHSVNILRNVKEKKKISRGRILNALVWAMYLPLDPSLEARDRRSCSVIMSASINVWMEAEEEDRAVFRKELAGCMEKTTDDS